MMNRRTLLIRTLVLASLLLASSHAAAQLSGPGGGVPTRPPKQQQQQQQQQNQGVNRIAPPIPPETDTLGLTSFMYYGLIAVLGGALVAVSVMPGKRGHQD